MKISKLILFIGLLTLIGLVPLISKSQTGSLEVCVHCINGDVVEGAIVTVGGIYSGTTGADGCINFAELMVGEWEVQCLIEGYPPSSTNVFIEEGILTECNIEIPCPEFDVSPLNIEVTLEPNEQSSEIITLSNPGQLSVEWTAELEIFPPGNFDWISIEPTSGILTAGETTEVMVYFDASDLIPWVYEAEIQFTTYPNVGSPLVNATMEIPGTAMPPYNLESSVNCVTVDLAWEISPLYYPPVTFNVYRDNEFIVNVSDFYYSDTSGYPEIPYEYSVSSVYTIGETLPSQPVEALIPLPDSLEPLNLENMAYYPDMYDITLWWDEPNTCIAPVGYNIYRDGDLIAEMVTELTFIDPDITWMYELVGYNVTAVYYFGESGFSNTTYFVNEGIEISKPKSLHLFPNPAKDNLLIQSKSNINRIELLNNLGLSIFNNKVNSNSYQLNVSHLSPGIYFVKLDTDQGLVLRKIVIE